MLKRLFYINREGTEITEPVLSLNIGEQHFGFAVTDRLCTELFSLAYHAAEEINEEILSGVFNEYPELRRPFSAVQVCYDHLRNVLIPIQHYDTEDTKTLLDTMHGANGRSSVISEIVNEWQLYNVYTVPGDVHDWVNRKFPSAKCRHHFTLGIKNMSAGSPDRLLVDIHTHKFSFIAIKENKLLIAQSQLYSSPEDILYYLLKTCHQFSLSQEKVQLSVSGLIEKESQLFREMYQFFIHVEFREPSWHIQATEGNEYPAHFFTTLNDLARCAS